MVHLELWLIPEMRFFFLDGIDSRVNILKFFKTYDLNELLFETILDWGDTSWCSILYRPPWFISGITGVPLY